MMVPASTSFNSAYPDLLCIFIIEPTGSLTLENIIVSNGRAVYDGVNPDTGNGGGIYNAGELTLINSAVIGNYASSNGGGIYNTGLGIVEVEAIIDANGNTIQDKAFILENNIAEAGQGGALYSNSTGNVTLTNGCIAGNTSSDNSAIFGTNSVTATNNWWGTHEGPSGTALGSGDAINSNVFYDPITTVPPFILGRNCENNSLSVSLIVEPALPYQDRNFTLTISNNTNTNITDFGITLYPFNTSPDPIPLGNPDINIPFRYVQRIQGSLTPDSATLTQNASNRTIQSNGSLVFEFIGISRRSGERPLQVTLSSATLNVDKTVDLSVTTNFSKSQIGADGKLISP